MSLVRSSGAFSKAGDRKKFSPRSKEASRDSTSRHKPLSPWQASSRNAARSSGARAAAEWKRSLTCCQRSAFIRFFPAQRPVKPGLGHVPFALHRPLREFQEFSRLLDRQTAEVAQFNNLTFSGILHGQLFQCFIEGEQFLRSRFRH